MPNHYQLPRSYSPLPLEMPLVDQTQNLLLRPSQDESGGFAIAKPEGRPPKPPAQYKKRVTPLTDEQIGMTTQDMVRDPLTGNSISRRDLIRNYERIGVSVDPSQTIPTTPGRGGGILPDPGGYNGRPYMPTIPPDPVYDAAYGQARNDFFAANGISSLETATPDQLKAFMQFQQNFSANYQAQNPRPPSAGGGYERQGVPPAYAPQTGQQYPVNVAPGYGQNPAGTIPTTPGIPPGGSPIGIINQPLPNLPVPPQYGTPGFDQGKMDEIRGLLGGGGLLPQEQQALDIISGAVARQGAAQEARAQTGFARRGLTGSSIEASGLAEVGGQTQRAIAESVSPVAIQFAERAARRNEQLAGFISDIGKMDAENQRKAIFQYAQDQLRVGEFNIGNIIKMRELGATLVQREIEDLRKKGLTEQRLAQEKELRLKELDNQLEQIRLKAEEARKSQILGKGIQQLYQFPSWQGGGTVLPPGVKPPGSTPIPITGPGFHQPGYRKTTRGEGIF